MISRQRQWQIRNRGKHAAQRALGQALIRGKLTKPSACGRCGATDKPIQAHHHRGYERQFRFDVQWLCTDCHYEIHSGKHPNRPKNPDAVAWGKLAWLGTTPEERKRRSDELNEIKRLKRANLLKRQDPQL